MADSRAHEKKIQDISRASYSILQEIKKVMEKKMDSKDIGATWKKFPVAKAEIIWATK